MRERESGKAASSRVWVLVKGSAWPALGLLLFGFFACNGGDESSDPEAAGGRSSDGSVAEGAGGSASRLLEACLKTCEKQADAKCADSLPRTECKSTCNTVQADKQCGSAYLAFAECGSTKASFSCTPTGGIEMTGCWRELQPYAECAACRGVAGDNCDTCSATNCCDERKAYWSQEDLVPFFGCEASCIDRDGGTSCGCATKYPRVVRALNDMLQCHRERCSSECP